MLLTNEEIQAKAKLDRAQYLLDQYAGQALRGLLAAGGEIRMDVGSYGNQTLRRQDPINTNVPLAWNYAEAMLAERKRRYPDAQ